MYHFSHACAPLSHLELAQALYLFIRVCAVGQQAGVIPMDDKVYAVLGEELFKKLWVEVVGHVGDDLIDPLDLWTRMSG